jgi:hypothetical protein
MLPVSVAHRLVGAHDIDGAGRALGASQPAVEGQERGIGSASVMARGVHCSTQVVAERVDLC